MDGREGGRAGERAVERPPLRLRPQPAAGCNPFLARHGCPPPPPPPPPGACAGARQRARSSAPAWHSPVGQPHRRPRSVNGTSDRGRQWQTEIRATTAVVGAATSGYPVCQRWPTAPTTGGGQAEWRGRWGAAAHAKQKKRQKAKGDQRRAATAVAAATVCPVAGAGAAPTGGEAAIAGVAAPAARQTGGSQREGTASAHRGGNNRARLPAPSALHPPAEEAAA